jgi:hypothetical protein
LHPRAATLFPSRPTAELAAAAASLEGLLPAAWSESDALAAGSAAQPSAAEPSSGELAAAADAVLAAEGFPDAAGAAAAGPPAADVQMAEAAHLEQAFRAAPPPAAQPVQPSIAAASANQPAQQLPQHVANGGIGAANADVNATTESVTQPAVLHSTLEVSASDISKQMVAAATAVPAVALAAELKQYSSDSEGSLPEIDSGPEDSGSGEEQA